MMWFTTSLVLALLASGSLAAPTFPSTPLETDSNINSQHHHNLIPNKYMLTFDPSIVSTPIHLREFAEYLQTEYPIQVLRQYPLFRMLLIHADDDHPVLTNIRNLPQVLRLSPDVTVHAMQDIPCQSNLNARTWGLDRIDQRIVLSDVTTDPPSSYYEYDPVFGNGEGAYAYVLDTGVEVTHSEFENRAVWGYTSPELGEGNTDGSGHGTHVAGIIAGLNFGVAKQVNIIAVKVLRSDGTGPASSVVSGLQWALADFNAKTSANSGIPPVAVINLSLSASTSEIGDAVLECVDAGIHVVISAGDSNANICLDSPVGFSGAIRVGASQVDDTTATFTNWGLCVDAYAPGVSIISAFVNGGTAFYSGTSMAAAHVSGVVVRYASMLSSAPAPPYVKDWLSVKYTVDALTFQSGQEPSQNRMVFADCEVPNASIP